MGTAGLQSPAVPIFAFQRKKCLAKPKRPMLDKKWAINWHFVEIWQFFSKTKQNLKQVAGNSRDKYQLFVESTSLMKREG
jgi:hypothetical protein